jgi:hypothetical protein
MRAPVRSSSEPSTDALLSLMLTADEVLQQGDAARELCQALLQLLAVEVRVGVLDFGFDLVDAAFDRLGVTGAVDDRRLVLADDHATGTAELGELGVLQLQPHLLGDHLGVGQDQFALPTSVLQRERWRDSGGEVPG